MPHEIRQIILSKDEFIGAIKSYKRTSDDALPRCDVVEYSVIGNGALHLHMKTHYGDSEQHLEIDLDGSHVLKILMRFCVENNIVLPPKAKKSYSQMNEDVCLMMKMNLAG
jgi:hypothetical protein